MHGRSALRGQADKVAGSPVPVGRAVYSLLTSG
jgi:hypothetical protein